MRCSILIMFGLFFYSHTGFATLISAQMLLERYSEGSCDVKITIDEPRDANSSRMTIRVDQIETDRFPPCSLGAAQLTVKLKSALKVYHRLGYGPMVFIILDNIKSYRWINSYQQVANPSLSKFHPPTHPHSESAYERIRSEDFIRDLLKPIKQGMSPFNMKVLNARCANMVMYETGHFDAECFIMLDGPWNRKQKRKQ